MFHLFCKAALIGLSLLCVVRADDDLSSKFGFSGLEIFKVSFRSGNLLAHDFNNDGRTDLLVVDNSHSRIDLFQQRDPKEKPSEDKPKSVNEVTSDGRFEHRKLPVDRQISAMTAGDFNGDGRIDIACLGLPDRLLILTQAEDGSFTTREQGRIAEPLSGSWTIDAGDLNSDGTDDLVVLGKSETWVYYQKEGKLAPPQKLLNTSDRLAIAQVADLDGDGKNDLCYLASEGQERLLCARLQGDNGTLDPELQFDVKRQRSLTIRDLDDAPGKEILTIDPLTNRVKVLKLQKPTDKSGELAGKLVQYGFGGEEGARDRDLALGDIDGDGDVDLIATDPSSAQVYLFRQSDNRGLDLGTTFPGLQGASQVRIGKTSKGGNAEVFTLSPKEKTIGVSRMEEGRLTIPEVLPVSDEPLALELADLDGDGAVELLYIIRKREGRSSNYLLGALKKEGDDWQPFKVSGDEELLKLELSSSPDRLSVTDVNRDGHPDFLVAQGSERPQLLILSDESGKLSVVESTSGFNLGLVAPGAMFLGTPQDPKLIVAQDKFARSFQLAEGNQWDVIEQFNASESNAKLVGSAVLNLDDEPGDEVVLVDAGVKRLRILKKIENQYQPWKEIELGEFPFVSAHVADLNSDGTEDLLLFGGRRFAILYAGRTDPELVEVASFETSLEKVFFSDVVAGDLSGDGKTDLAIIDTRSHYLEVLDYDAEEGLKHALQFKVFEEKSFSSNDEGGGSEPREGVIADVTGDGLNDLILLVHDRILVYPQDKVEPAISE